MSKERKAKVKRPKRYKKQSDLTKTATKKAVKRSKRRALTAAEKRRKVALHNAIAFPRMAFRNSGVQMPADTKVRKKTAAEGAFGNE